MGILLPSKSNLIEDIFPRLKTSKAYTIKSECTARYNCIAFAAGDEDRWWWPLPKSPMYYWPPDVPRELSVEAFVAAFESIGYQVCPDGRPEMDHDKIVLYVNDGAPTHAARLNAGSSVWLSKLGELYDIEHNSAIDVGGVSVADYGDPHTYMIRPVN